MPTSNHHSRITQPPDGNSYPSNAMLASAAEIEAAIPTRTRTRNFHRPLTTRPRKVSTVNSTEIPLSSPPSSQDHSEWGEPIDVDLVDEEQQSSPQLTPTSSTTPDHRSLSIEPQSRFCDNIASSSSLDDLVQRGMHRDDARDQLFVGIIKALVHVNNTPSSPKDLAKYIMEENFAILGGKTPWATVSSRISMHNKRASEHRPARVPLLDKQVNPKNARGSKYFIASLYWASLSTASSHQREVTPDQAGPVEDTLDYSINHALLGEDTPDYSTEEESAARILLSLVKQQSLQSQQQQEAAPSLFSTPALTPHDVSLAYMPSPDSCAAHFREPPPSAPMSPLGHFGTYDSSSASSPERSMFLMKGEQVSMDGSAIIEHPIEFAPHPTASHLIRKRARESLTTDEAEPNIALLISKLQKQTCAFEERCNGEESRKDGRATGERGVDV